MTTDAASEALLLSALYLHPIKSCGAIAVEQSVLIETGFEYDRAWMVVDPQGVFVSQRELPRMALVKPTLRTSDLVLRAPGMLALHLLLDTVEAACQVRIWKDSVAAFDMGNLAAQWFSDFLGRPLRLARFDPARLERRADPAWAGVVEAPTAFVDQFPLLVTSTASLAELNRRMLGAGLDAVTMRRFRPNIVLDGLQEPHGEDHLDELTIDSIDGPVLLKMTKPCTRCTVPDIDPDSAAVDHRVNDMLARYRADAKMGGAVTFGRHAVVVAGIEHRLRVGAKVRATFDF